VSFFDRPARVDRTKVVLAAWHRQRTEVLPGVAPVALMLARTDDTAVALTDLRGYPNGFAFLLRLRWGPSAGREELPPDQPVLTEGAGIDSEGGGLGRGAYWDLDHAVQPPAPAGAAGLHLHLAGPRDPRLAGCG
jgi:hypothetical protein